jgi:nucleoside-diphosphate-sugar epimerase
LAALPLAKLDNLNSEEAREGSVDTTANFLEIINQIKGRSGWCPERFVYASSSMVYGDFQSDVATEDHPTRPKEIYGTMKLAGEIITFGLGRFFDLPVTGIRPSAVYGPTDMNRRVSQIFLEKALLGQRLNIQGADEALDFTYVKDVANGFVLAATNDDATGEIFNITTGHAHTLLDFVECLKEHFPDLKYDLTERDSFRPKRGTLSIDKARRLLGYEPQYTLKNGIAEYVEFVKLRHNSVAQVSDV